MTGHVRNVSARSVLPFRALHEGTSIDRMTSKNTNTVVLYHHPFSRAANVVWMLEEIGQPYDLRFVDLMKGEHKSGEVAKLNAMGKLPVLTDGDAVVSESAAIGLFLADRYSYGTLAPKVDESDRGTYLRWSLFAPSVIEPGSVAKSAGWSFRPAQAGWGEHESMAELCRAFGVSRKTGYKLVARYESEGASAFADRSRAPRTRGAP